MPCIKDKSTVQAIARAFTSKAMSRDKEKTLLEVGYTKSYARSIGMRIYERPEVIAAIKAIDDDVQVKYEYNLDIALDLLRRRLTYLEEKAKDGDTQAVQAQTAIIRELNDITGLHKINVHASAEQAPAPLSEQDRQELQEAARRATFTLKLRPAQERTG